MKPKISLDDLLVLHGLAESKTQAQRLIMAGLVRVNGQRQDKAGSKWEKTIKLELLKSPRFVSRGGIKLEHVLREFAVTVTDKICADIGASTGGFSDCLLQHGAKKIFAIDVGHSQLHYKLQKDVRVINLERTHFKSFKFETVLDPVTFFVMDVSFISVSQLLPTLKNWMDFLDLRNGFTLRQAVILIKPQFECGPKYLSKGILKDANVREACVANVLNTCEQLGFKNCRTTPSPINGTDGNKEVLLCFKNGSSDR